MIGAHRVISADDHVVEAPGLWIERLPAAWGERRPHLRVRPNGSEAWVVDGRETPLSEALSIGACLSDRAPGPDRWSDVPPAARSPGARLSAMDADGVDYSVLYPSFAGAAGQALAAIADPLLERACVEAYNDWLVETWVTASPRFVAQCLVPLSDPAAAAAEIRRAVKRGHRGVIMPGVPEHARQGAANLADPGYDVVWCACEEMDIPVCLHAGASSALELDPSPGFSPAIAAAFRAIARPAGLSGIMSNFLISGVLERFPSLKVVFAESSFGLAPFIVETANYAFHQQRLEQSGLYRMTPSEAFKGRCHVTSWYDNAGLRRAADFLGPDALLWSTNYPQATSTWPDTRRFVGTSFAEFDEAVTAKVLWQNAARLYRLPE